MREIKFRFYYQNNKTGEWRKYEQTLDEIIDQDSWQGVRIFVFKATCQYTGLKDKNGKEIFEGDIVKWGDHCNWCKENPIRIAEVKINPDIQFVDSVTKHNFQFGCFAYQDTSHLEGIGNVFEHPHLLKQ